MSIGGSVESAAIDEGRSSTPPLVWKALYPQMFGRATIARTRASISGSESGWSPDPRTFVPHPAGKLRFMSRPSGGAGVGTVKPS